MMAWWGIFLSLCYVLGQDTRQQNMTRVLSGEIPQDQILLSWASCSLGCRLYTVEHKNNIKSENYKRSKRVEPREMASIVTIGIVAPHWRTGKIYFFSLDLHAKETDVLLALIGFPPVCLFWVANTISWKVAFCELPQLPCKHFDWAVSDCMWEKGRRYFVLFALLITMHNTVSVHCREEGCFGKYIPRGPKDFPGAGILHPAALENALRGAKSPPSVLRPNCTKILTMDLTFSVCSTLLYE